jgi:hypothetical protein
MVLVILLFFHFLLLIFGLNICSRAFGSGRNLLLFAGPFLQMFNSLFVSLQFRIVMLLDGFKQLVEIFLQNFRVNLIFLIERISNRINSVIFDVEKIGVSEPKNLAKSDRLL